MIGVIAGQAENGVVREFFELFKTPWEWYREGRGYDVVLCAGDGDYSQYDAKLILAYAGRKLLSDAVYNIRVSSLLKVNRVLTYRGARIPIYGDSITFQECATNTLLDEDSEETALHDEEFKQGTLVRIGYDLFNEIRLLLTKGQPVRNANYPTLELHIAVLRELIISSGASLMEIPPVPKGYRFIACLTHDVDHPFIRAHKLDHTTLGFLYRAVIGSFVSVLRRRRSVRTMLTNWAAACRLPFVHLGLVEDHWSGFDRYTKLEGGAHSSFFLIPFKGTPGKKDGRPAPKRRAARYGASDLVKQIRTLSAEGCEIGLHGIDAWHDVSKGREELEEVRRITGKREIGVRMHWLYFDDESPITLEQAGADYDSTVGYNETVGYRAGTTQVYRPLGTVKLLELPLHIMDTALFYPSHLALSPADARRRVSAIIDHAVEHGGVVTINWHDRSIVPERLWGDFYLDLTQELRAKGGWLTTASDAVSWFRRRRAMTFEDFRSELGPANDIPTWFIRAQGVDDLRTVDVLSHADPIRLQPETSIHGV